MHPSTEDLSLYILCNMTFDNTEVITLLTEFIILYKISKSLVPEDKSEVKIKIPEGTYTSYQFNKKKIALKEKGNHWVPPQKLKTTNSSFLKTLHLLP